MGSGLRSEPGRPQLTGLAAAGAGRPRALVLGSFPSVASLAGGQYYAHARNQFWPIMAELFGFAASLPYRQRLAQLAARQVAIWDVLASAKRVGSADAAIETGSMRTNDIAGLLCRTGSVEVIALNGGFAGRAFRRYLDANPKAARLLAGATILPMPSTSPAYAGRSLAAKLEDWRRLADALRQQ